MLPQGNFQVLEARDGLEGLNLIRQEKLSLILLDFVLPKVSGWEVFQEIQSQPDLKKIPLLIMSGRKQEVMEKIPEPFEYFEFIEKPFDQKQLIDAVKSAMKKAKQPRQEPVELLTVSTTIEKTETSSQETSTTDIQILNQKIASMQTEIDSLNKQLAKVMRFLQQRIK
jgi:DNA-binding response OmpR family regulator